MARRKLNRRQQWRIQKIQDEKIRRARHQRQHLENDIRVVDEALFHGLVVSHYGASLDIEITDPETAVPCKTIRCALRQNIDPIVCGDNVVWQKIKVLHHSQDNIIMEGVVTALETRRTVLARPDFSGMMKPVAANIDQVLVVTSPVPEFNEGLVDRYLVAARLSNVPAVLVLNKIDTLDQEQRQQLQSRTGIYNTIGYPVIYTSAVSSHGLEPLYRQLEGRTSVFVGQSGVGKSSLINALLPDALAKTAEVSQATSKGRHTTSVSRLYHLQGHGMQNGRLIDSPGVREFGLWDVSGEDVIHGFIEFPEYADQCKFRDCKHLNEPGCGLLQAVKEGHISRQRLESYHRIVDSIEEKKRR